MITAEQLTADIVKIADFLQELRSAAADTYAEDKATKISARSKYFDTKGRAESHILQTLLNLDLAHENGLIFPTESIDLGDGRTLEIHEEWSEFDLPLKGVNLKTSPPLLSDLRAALEIVCPPY